MTKNEVLELVPYTPLWKKYFQKEKTNLKKLLRNNLVAVHHIGSTAIPLIKARPTLDLLAVVHTHDGIEAFSSEFAKTGLKKSSLLKKEDTLFFERLSSDSSRTITSIKVLEKHKTEINDDIDFRDYLNAEPEMAKNYENLKLQLAKEGQVSLYQAAKKEFIETVLKNIT